MPEKCINVILTVTNGRCLYRVQKENGVMLHCEHLAKTLKEMPSEKKSAKNEMLKTSSLSRYISDLILKVEYPFFISLAVQCSVEVRDQFQLE